MNRILVEMVPLGLAAAVSPTLLSATVLILGSKNRPRAGAAAFLLGSGLSIVIIAFLLMAAGGKAFSTTGQSSLSAGVDVVLGTFLFGLGVRRILKPPQPKAKKTGPAAEEGPAREEGKYLGLGAVMTLTNFSSLVFVATAAREIVGARLDAADETIAMGIVIFLYLLPVLLPLGVTLIAPGASARALAALNGWLKKYNNYIIAAIAVGFGIYLFARGAPVLF